MANTIPATWRRTTLGEIAAPLPNAIVDGPFGSNLKTSDYVDEGVPVLQGKNITNDTFRWFDVRFISDRKATELKRSSVRIGDILIVKIGSIGYSAIVDDLNGFEFAIIPANLAKVTPDASKIDLGFLHKWLTSIDAKRYLNSVASKTAQPALSLGKIKSLPLLLPPLAEQRRIAHVLDRAEALRAKRRAALAQLDSLTQSLFLDLFGDPVRNEKSWPTAKVLELCELVRGSSPRPQGDPQFFGGPVPRLMVADITRDGWLVTPIIDSLTVEGAKRSRPVPAGTVVMAVSGNVGLVSRLAIDACVHDGFVAFTQLNELRCQPGFLLALLHFSKALHEKHKAGAIFINLTTTDIKAMSLPLPPISLQREFARRITAVEKLKAAQRASLAELDALFASLQYRAFRGEL